MSDGYSSVFLLITNVMNIIKLMKLANLVTTCERNTTS